jgi:hypothetical protein
LGKGRRNPELGSISDGIVAFMVAGESAWVKAARAASTTAAAQTRGVTTERRRGQPVPIEGAL